MTRYWQDFYSASMWRLWSICKSGPWLVRPTSFNAHSSHGRCQNFGITTIKSDSLTLCAIHETDRTRMQCIRQIDVKDVV
jgi:hypothetical protein